MAAAKLLLPLLLRNLRRKFRWTAMLWTNPVVVVVAMIHGMIANVKRLAICSNATLFLSLNDTLTE